MDDLAPIVGGYARRFHAAALAAGPAHHVASPLGAWIVLALAADALDGPARTAAGARLGCSVEVAAAAARVLLEDPHPAVAAAVACWADAARLGPHLATWARSLPGPVETGPVPTQDAADRWASERTRGLIGSFPVTVDPETVLVLASALATEVTWTVPFDLTPGADLGGAWGARVAQALAREGSTRLVDTPSAGLVAVTDVGSDQHVTVLTVSADPEVEPVDVIAAAHEVAGPGATDRSLFDLPLGPGHSWDLVETVEDLAVAIDRAERTTAVLPAWTATTTHPLLADDRFGFTEVAAHLLATLPHNDDGWILEAAQAVTATYDRQGFRAAAVTAMAARGGGAPPAPRPVTVRTLRARYDHPHAVVAVALGSAWHRLPVFSAWVTDPTDAA